MLTKSIAVKQTTISSATSTTATAYNQPVKYQSICWLHRVLSSHNNEASLNAVQDKNCVVRWFGNIAKHSIILFLLILVVETELPISITICLLKERYPKPAVGEENILTDNVCLQTMDIGDMDYFYHQNSCECILEGSVGSAMKKFHFFANCIGPDESLHW
ncbi:hypothetical protein Tsp_03654 [Trichinella spiralis]|uniref:hypothetical protein n=1 Tax=Trichinella spiralis TaxID=6334 RepID=UPI0001EFB736|nr:hypothetical protein Tsp_03654 [Trichinella spiralis]